MPILSSIANSLATVNGVILSDEQSLMSEKQVSTCIYSIMTLHRLVTKLLAAIVQNASIRYFNIISERKIGGEKFYKKYKPLLNRGM